MLDLSGYQLTFDEEFNSINISQGGARFGRTSARVRE